MLSALESKIVISTLTKRRSWLRKTLDDANLDPDVRKEHSQTLGHLDSAMKKLANMAPTKPVKAPTVKTDPTRKEISIETLRVLVAEDQEESLTILVTILEDMGVKQVDTASDGREAFDKIKVAKYPYDIILCDWDMPELSGLEIHQKASASNTLNGAHFCMVTGVSEAGRIREAIQQGINDYIVKPVDPNTLEAKLKATVDAKKALP